VAQQLQPASQQAQQPSLLATLAGAPVRAIPVESSATKAPMEKSFVIMVRPLI
jgi:hypothetical protein